ncbi:MAG: rhomboid family intramembrane serine protease [Deltaproteobacteria bacterium]|nr:rhomboid family intramembrane serine protease [Deltaproteobacteria bacterium]
MTEVSHGLSQLHGDVGNWIGNMIRIGYADDLLGLLVMTVSMLAFAFPGLYRRLMFLPDAVTDDSQIWRIVTYAFVHLGWVHLTVNLLTLASFGRTLAVLIGGGGMLLIFVAGSLAGPLLSLLRHDADDVRGGIVGASGGIAAMIGAVAFLQPKSTLLLGFLLPVPMRVGVMWILVLSIVLHVLGWGKRIWHFGHATGLAVGILIGHAINLRLIHF